jgi:pimeloyl-ACP methyl ester carboxylesterase
LLSYRIQGKGDPLLLIHGWGVTFNVWQRLAPLLSPHFQLILVELPGVNDASKVMPGKPYYEFCAERLEEFRVELGIERWAILAYSIGTRVSEAYIQRYAQRVSRAVFLCPIYLTHPWMRTVQAGKWLNARHADLASWFLSDWRLYGWLLAVGFNLHGRDYANEWMAEIEERPLENLKRMLLELPGKGRAPFKLPESPAVPSLFVWGLNDLLTARPAHPHPNDVFIFANHGAPVLKPERVAAVVLPFLKGEATLTPVSARGKRRNQPGKPRLKIRVKAPKRFVQVGRRRALPARWLPRSN